MFFDTWSDLVRVVVITMLAYASLILLLRISGKRSLAKLNIFDFVVTIALGSTLATVLLSSEVSFAEGVLALAMLALLQWIVSYGSVRADWFKRMIRSEPRLLLRDGDLMGDAMRDERITRGEIESAVRKAGIGDLAQVAAVVLETDGELSVVARSSAGDRSVLEAVETAVG